MDGKLSTVILDGPQVIWPNGLAIDFATNTLYLADAQIDIIAKSRTDGSNYQVVKNLLNSTITRTHPFALEYHDGFLYWGELFQDSLFKLDVRNGEAQGDVQLVNHVKTDPGEFRVVNIARQPLGISE